MGIGGIETGVRDIANYLNKKKIENYILCESDDKNFNVKGLKIIKIGNLRFKNIFDQNKRYLMDIIFVFLPRIYFGF